MKQIILTTILAFTTISLNAQTLYGYYTNHASKAKTKYKIEYVLNGLDEKPCVLIEVIGEADKNYLMVDIDSLSSIQKGFRELKAKYIEWCDVAIKNNVTEVEKEMKYPFHGGIGASWYNSDWWFSRGFSWNLKPTFKIKGASKIVSFAQAVRSDSNEFVTNNVYLIFTSVQDFDSLINMLNSNKISAKIKNAKSMEDLFK